MIHSVCVGRETPYRFLRDIFPSLTRSSGNFGFPGRDKDEEKVKWVW